MGAAMRQGARSLLAFTVASVAAVILACLLLAAVGS